MIRNIMFLLVLFLGFFFIYDYGYKLGRIDGYVISKNNYFLDSVVVGHEYIELYGKNGDPDEVKKHLLRSLEYSLDNLELMDGLIVGATALKPNYFDISNFIGERQFDGKKTRLEREEHIARLKRRYKNLVKLDLPSKLDKH